MLYRNFNFRKYKFAATAGACFLKTVLFLWSFSKKNRTIM